MEATFQQGLEYKRDDFRARIRRSKIKKMLAKRREDILFEMGLTRKLDLYIMVAGVFSDPNNTGDFEAITRLLLQRSEEAEPLSPTEASILCLHVSNKLETTEGARLMSCLSLVVPQSTMFFEKKIIKRSIQLIRESRSVEQVAGLILVLLTISGKLRERYNQQEVAEIAANHEMLLAASRDSLDCWKIIATLSYYESGMPHSPTVIEAVVRHWLNKQDPAEFLEEQGVVAGSCHSAQSNKEYLCGIIIENMLCAATSPLTATHELLRICCSSLRSNIQDKRLSQKLKQAIIRLIQPTSLDRDVELIKEILRILADQLPTETADGQVLSLQLLTAVAANWFAELNVSYLPFSPLLINMLKMESIEVLPSTIDAIIELMKIEGVFDVPAREDIRQTLEKLAQSEVEDISVHSTYALGMSFESSQ